MFRTLAIFALLVAPAFAEDASQPAPVSAAYIAVLQDGVEVAGKEQIKALANEQPGVYTLLILSGHGKPITIQVSIVADGIGPIVPVPIPPNPIPPTPTPTPNPKPDPADFWAVVIEESGERLSPIARVIGSAEVRAMFRDNHFRVVDKDSSTTDWTKPYLERAKGKELPQLFLVNGVGNIFFEGKLPSTVNDTKELIKKSRGDK